MKSERLSKGTYLHACHPPLGHSSASTTMWTAQWISSFLKTLVPVTDTGSVRDSSLTHALSRLCCRHSCVTMICNSVRQDRPIFFPSPEISTHKHFTSDTFNLIMHALAPECECISFPECLYLCDSEKKPAGGADGS